MIELEKLKRVFAEYYLSNIKKTPKTLKKALSEMEVPLFPSKIKTTKPTNKKRTEDV